MWLGMHRLWWLSALLLVACLPYYAVQGRAYEVRVPKSYDGKTPLPLVIMAHGHGATGQLQDSFFPVSNQVDAKQFLYALPNGTVDRFGKRFWNATEACCNSGKSEVDDVGFFRALVDDIKQRYPVKEGHVFLVGHSNGAFMSLRLAVTRATSSPAWWPCRARRSKTRAGAARGSPSRSSSCTETRTPRCQSKADPASSPARRRPARVSPAATTVPARGETANGSILLGGADTESQQSLIDGCTKTGSVELWTHEGTGHLPLYDTRWTSKMIHWLEEPAR